MRRRTSRLVAAGAVQRGGPRGEEDSFGQHAIAGLVLGAVLLLLTVVAIAWVAHCSALHSATGIAAGSDGVWPTGPRYEPDTHAVRRIAWQADRPFVDRILEHRPRGPLVLSQTLASRWRAVQRWTPSYLSHRLGNEIFPTKVSETPVFQYVNHDLLQTTQKVLAASASDHNLSPGRSRYVNLTMSQFWAGVAQQNITGTWLQFSGELQGLPALKELAIMDLPGVRTWMSPSSSNRGLRGSSSPKLLQSRQQLWLGGGGSTSQPHYDHQHNMYVQLHGVKRFILSPPSAVVQSAKLFPRLHACTRHSMADFLGTPMPPLTYALAEEELPLPNFEVALRPGEVLYIPPFWLHRVEATNMSVSVSSWFDDAMIQELINISAGMPLLPSLHLGAHDESEIGPSTRKVVAVLWAYQKALSTIGARAAMTPGKNEESLMLGQELWSQRYQPWLGQTSTRVRHVWRQICMPAEREQVLTNLSQMEKAELEGLIAAKRSLFAAFIDADDNDSSSLSNSDLSNREYHADGICRLLVLDEFELSIALLLGSARVVPFLEGCFAPDRHN